MYTDSEPPGNGLGPGSLALTLLFAAFIITLPRYTELAKTGYLLLLLCALGYFAAHMARLAETSRIEKTYFAIVILNFLWIAFSYYVNGQPESGGSFLWDRHFYLLFLIPLYFLFRSVPISNSYLILALCCSLYLAFGDILLDLARGLDYRFKGMNPNGFGPIQLTLAGIAFIYFYQYRQNRLRWIVLPAALLGIGSVIFSQSKNTWLTLVILTLAAVFYLTRHFSTGKRVAAGLALLMILSSLYLVPTVQSRIDAGLSNIFAYFTSDDPRAQDRLGTFGTRMQFWAAGWFAFTEHPLTGIGVGGMKAFMQDNYQALGEQPQVRRYSKYVHNQYLAALATRGFPGLLLNLLLLALPIYIALTHKAREAEDGFARLSLILLCLVYGLGNFFEDHLETRPAIMFISVMIPLLLATLGRRRQPSLATASR